VEISTGFRHAIRWRKLIPTPLRPPIPPETQGPFHVRSRIPGKHELRVIHPRLPKPFYKTFDDPDEAGRVGERALVVLEKGEVPEWLVRPVSDSAVTVAQAILSYRNIRAVPASTEGLLDTLGAEIDTTPLADINYDWTEQWISGSARSSVRSTSRPARFARRRARFRACWIGWLVHIRFGSVRIRSITCRMGTPDMTRTAAQCSHRTESILLETASATAESIGSRSPTSCRCCRLRRESSTLLEEQAEAEGLSLMFQLALRTAMRMRELYTLAQDQISITARTIFLQKTKNGDRREVPISSHGLMLLNTPWPALEATR
jgi:hypothetical protein